MLWEWHVSMPKHPPYLRLSILTAGVWNIFQTPMIMDVQHVHPNHYWSQLLIQLHHKKKKSRRKGSGCCYGLVEILWSGSGGPWNFAISQIMQQMLCPCYRTPNETMEPNSEVLTGCLPKHRNLLIFYCPVFSLSICRVFAQISLL